MEGIAKKIFEVFDYILLLCVLILVILGIAFIYSSGVNSEGVLVTNEYIKQIIWASIGLVFLIFFAFFDYRKFEKGIIYFYFGLLAVLLYTRFFGRYVNGARSWIGIGEFGIQPSEFGKIIYTVMLAKYLSSSENEHPFKRFVISTIIFVCPVLLILLQPDLGTATVYFPIYFVMCFLAGVKLKYLGYVLGTGTLTILFTVLPVWNEYILSKPILAINALSNQNIKVIITIATLTITLMGFVFRRYFHGPKYFFWISYAFSMISVALIFSSFTGKVLKEYQIQRLIVFLDPSIDPRGYGWNIIQSKIAIGSGGIFGRSFLNGTQSHYRFLPEQSTDFIFSIYTEEMGFLGGLIVFILYFIIMTRILIIIKNTSNKFGTYIAGGILAIFMIHFFINTGMVMGIMPITGIPLLFMSYGGSSLLMAMSAIGLIMSIRYRKYNFS